MYIVSLTEKIEVFAKYRGQKVWVKSLHHSTLEPLHQFGWLTGVKTNCIKVEFEGKEALWFNLLKESAYDIRLLLHPLSRLTEEIKQIANSLPIQNFITQYYISEGFDMPLFFAPGHPGNCKYVEELNLADYRTEEEIIFEGHLINFR